ncbi:hypothetical protein Pst134EA_022682 [Puccinia striiformis f. sp. tritici]|uniref:Uncharacterized protein n=1 Tax=Puccinia striiformis f. sp. tritici PST-78 TaxID=1165861 RepID=A0A0L0VQ87_9BASI|nr:hypothetical protein Pst134EA_022682 [Puccinia striiformis f. sp. tritici]KAH9455208.1 hypothetical protein Pst134EA_022682 [Puccinia striiformis f. sp. tritici]KNF01434.1 hypothetical protein PSTG_05219 [Puccinia striiformis f. sp. tritici PST-78]
MKLSSIFLTLIICHGLFEFSDATPVPIPKKHHGHKDAPEHTEDHRKKTKDHKETKEHKETKGHHKETQKHHKETHSKSKETSAHRGTKEEDPSVDSDFLKVDWGGNVLAYEGYFEE